MIGPTMGILAHNAHVTYNGIASALASAAAGGLLTNILYGICQKYIDNYQDLMLALFFGLRGIRKIQQIFFSYYITSLLIDCCCSCSCYTFYPFIDTIMCRILFPRYCWKFYQYR